MMTVERQASIRIETPEGVSFSYPLAGPVTRFAAWLIDALVILTVLSALSKVIGIIAPLTPGVATAAGILGYFVVSIGYGMFLEWRWRGQTIGKRLLKVRVMDAEGLRLTFQQIAIRNLLRAVDSLPALYAVGGVSMVVSRYAQRLGDMAAGTIVVRQSRSNLVVPETLRTGNYNSFAQWPHLVARLRQKASLDLIAIAVNALERRDQFEPSRRLELFRDLAERFREIVAFPDEASAFLTDEQYVRGLVDEMTRVRRRKPA
jgi:uncharacterized RDD family membrane protein YckC